MMEEWFMIGFLWMMAGAGFLISRELEKPLRRHR
jgi:hypothetical protein